MKKIFSFLIIITFLLFIGQVAQAFKVDLGWSASSSKDIKGYTVHYDTNSGYPKSNSFDAGNVLEATILNLTAETIYYFVVTAYDWEGRKSGPSNEVRTDGITTPDTGQDPIAPGCFIIATRP